MSKQGHSSGEFGKPMSTVDSAGFGDQGGSNMGAASQILLTGIDEEKSGITPSRFTIASWKIAVTLAIIFLIGVGGLYVMHRTGWDRPRGDTEIYVGR